MQGELLLDMDNRTRKIYSHRLKVSVQNSLKVTQIDRPKDGQRYNGRNMIIIIKVEDVSLNLKM